jgi:RNA recognition motif-containing protein
MSDSIYVGQLPVDMQESDIRKLFPKAKTVNVTPAAGPRPGLVLFFLTSFFISIISYL